MSSADPQVKERLSRAVDPLHFDVEKRLRVVRQRSSARLKARRVVAVVVAAVVAVAAVAAAWLLLPLRKDGDRAGTGGPAGKIAYTRVTVTGEDINWDVHAANADGSQETSLVTGPGAAYGPTWSPDGSQIAFISVAGDAPELWVVNADGSDARPIVQDPPPVGDQAPSWSPDGTRIAFIASEETGSALWTVRADGTGARRIRQGNWQQVGWSPDGTKLALAGFGEADPALFVVDADGSGLLKLADFDDLAAFPSWSPDGTRIVVMVHSSEDEFDYRYDIHSVNADGSGTTRLTDWEGFDGFPVWSPDGRWIAISSDRDATGEQLSRNRNGEGWFGASLYLMRPDGSEFRLIVQAGEASLLATSWVR